MKESISVIKEEGKIVGYGFGNSDGAEHFADINHNEQVIHRHSDSSPQGEESTLEVCEIIVQKKNKLGDDWTKLTQSTGVADFISRSKSNMRRELRMQVVRANVDNIYWRELNVKKSLPEKIHSIEELCEIMKKAIDLKLERIPEVSREGITLVLDATVLPQLCMSDGVEYFKTKYGDNLKSTGFEEIWLVGPHIKMTFKIF